MLESKSLTKSYSSFLKCKQVIKIIYQVMNKTIVTMSLRSRIICLPKYQFQFN